VSDLERRLAAAAELVPAVPPEPARRADVEAWLNERRAEYQAHGKRLRDKIPQMPPKNPANAERRAELYLAKMEAEHEAATAWLASISSVPESWIDATQRAFELVNIHVADVKRRLDLARKALAQLKEKRAAGQAVWRRNAESARAKLLAAIRKEEQRHADAVDLLSAQARGATTPRRREALLADVEREEARHAAAVAEFQRKAAWVVSALATAAG
jgi:hypothetical protein